MSFILSDEDKEALIGMAGSCPVADAAAQFGVTQFYVRRTWAQAGKPVRPRKVGERPEAPPAPAIQLSDSYVEHCIRAFEAIPRSHDCRVPIVWQPSSDQKETAAAVPALLRELLRRRKKEHPRSIADIASQAQTLGME